MAEMTDDDILAELGVDLAPKKTRARTPREERIIAGFEDIVKFREEHARDDATFLLSDVDVVATYKLYDVNRPKLEALIHRVLDAVRFDAAIPDRFGKPVRPKEWFMVPLPVVDDIVSRIGDGTLAGMIYDSKNAALNHQRAFGSVTSGS